LWWTSIGHVLGPCAFTSADADAEAVFKRLVDEVHGGQAPEVLTQAVKDGILVNIRCGHWREQGLSPQDLSGKS
jgi:hypothetical protein